MTRPTLRRSLIAISLIVVTFSFVVAVYAQLQLSKGVYRFCPSETVLITRDWNHHQTTGDGIWISVYIDRDSEQSIACEGKYGGPSEFPDDLSVTLEDGTMVRYQAGNIQSQGGDNQWITEYTLSELHDDTVRRYVQARTGSNTIQFPSQPYDIAVFKGNVYFAMGWYGVLVRNPAGKYHWEAVGHFQLETFSTISKKDIFWLNLLMPEIYLATVLFLLVVPWTVSITRGYIGRALYVATAMFVVIQLSTFPVTDSGVELAFHRRLCFLPLCWLLGSIISINMLNKLWHDTYLMLFCVSLSLITVTVYLFPYALWIRGVPLNYFATTIIALTLSVITVFVGQLCIHKSLPSPVKIKVRKANNDSISSTM